MKKTFRIQNLELDIVEINAKLNQQINERTTIISAREKDLSELEVFHLISFFNYCLYLLNFLITSSPFFSISFSLF